MKKKFKIGDKVVIRGESITIYIVYAITIYKERIAYTIWKGTEYETVAEWQIIKAKKIDKIGFTPSPIDLGIMN